MKRPLIFILAFLMNLSLVVAQQTALSNQESTRLNRAVALYNQKNYKASKALLQRYLSDEKKEVDGTSQAFHQEALYYLYSNQYALKDRTVRTPLEDFLNNYSYSPYKERVCYMIGRLYYEKKNYQAALKYYNKISQTQLNEEEGMEYLYTKGFSHLQMKQYKLASYIFESLNTTNQERQQDAAYYYAYAEFQLKNFNHAVPVLKRLQFESKYAESASLLLLQAYDQTGNPQTIDFGKDFITRFPKCTELDEANRIVGTKSYEKGQFVDAATYLKAYVGLAAKDDRNTVYQLGIALFETEDYKAAGGYLSTITKEEDALSQNAFIYLGHCYLKQNEIANARMAFQQAATMDFDAKAKEEAAYNYAMATYESKAPFGETIRSLETFLADYPSSKRRGSIYLAMSDVFMNGKDYEKAIQAINKIKNPSSDLLAAKEQAYFQIGVEHYDAHEYDQAITAFSNSLTLFNGQSASAQAYLWRGECYYKLHDNVNARKNYIAYTTKAATQIDAQAYRITLYNIAYTYYNQKDYTQSKLWFEKFAEQSISEKHKDNYYADAEIRLADVYYLRRDFTNAQLHYNRVPSISRVADYAMYQNAFIDGLKKDYTAKINKLEMLLKNHKGSDYTDDARYEIGRSYIALDQNPEAIKTFKTLLAKQPLSPLARKAALEIGMLYNNMGQENNAILAYKKVVEKYPNSSEARLAIESMESIYIDLNKVNEYVTYRESISGTSITKVAKNKADSLSFLAAEKLFSKEKYQEAATTLNAYIKEYCDNRTLNCINAMYYLAESDYQIGQKEEALSLFDDICRMPGNNHREDALLRASELAYDKKDYINARDYFNALNTVASNNANKEVSKLGLLRCNFKTNQYQAVISSASNLLDFTSDEALIREAHYCRAKAYLALNQGNKAIGDLKTIKDNLRYEMGAEAKFLYTDYLYNQKDYKTAEAEALNFIQNNTPYQYWMARAFITLAQCYEAEKDYFQSRQYLTSLQKNYTNTDDDILQRISTQLQKLDALEAQVQKEKEAQAQQEKEAQKAIEAQQALETQRDSTSL